MFKQGNFNISSTGTLDITGLGFQPGPVLFQWRPANATNAGGMGWGAGDTSTSMATSTGYTSSNFARNSAGSNSCYVINTSNTAVTIGNYTTALPDGFRLSVATATASQAFSYLAFKQGANVSVGAFSVSSTGTLDVTTAGFQPEGALIFWLPQSTTHAAGFSSGAFDKSLSQFVSFFSVGSGAQNAFTSGSFAIAVNNISGTATTRAAVTQMLSNGFRLNVTTATGSQDFLYIAFGPNMRASVGNFSITNGASSFSATSSSIRPEAAVIVNRPPTTTGLNIESGMGMTDTTFSQSASAMNTLTRNQATSNAILRKATTGATNTILAQVTNWLSNGFSGSVATSSSTSNFSYLALASAANNVAFNRRRLLMR